jgi:hypothetical protein
MLRLPPVHGTRQCRGWENWQKAGQVKGVKREGGGETRVAILLLLLLLLPLPALSAIDSASHSTRNTKCYTTVRTERLLGGKQIKIAPASQVSPVMHCPI